MKEKLKNTKGITLIALIMTIIVLIILAIVSIKLVMDSDIITNSKTATNNYVVEEEKEKIKLGLAERKMAMVNDPEVDLSVNGATVATVDGDAKNGWTVTFDETGNVYTVDANGNITSKDQIRGTSVTLVNGESLGAKVVLGKPTIDKNDISQYLIYSESTSSSCSEQLEIMGTDWSFEITACKENENIYFEALKYYNENDGIRTSYLYAFQDMVYETANVRAGQWYVVSETDSADGLTKIATVTPIDGSEIVLENMVYTVDESNGDYTEAFNNLYKDLFIKVE